MVASKRFLTSVLIAVTYSSVASAFQAKEDAFSHSTHRVRHISRELSLETYHPESSYEVRNAISITCLHYVELICCLLLDLHGRFGSQRL